jgi:hypothetical protein
VAGIMPKNIGNKTKNCKSKYGNTGHHADLGGSKTSNDTAIYLKIKNKMISTYHHPLIFL